MKRDELLTTIEESELGWYYDWMKDALRAVVELHKPDEYGGTRCQAHDECWGCGEWGNSTDCPCDKYPCETIRAIERAFE